ncbi:MAG: DUF4878 domain-containing protein [Aureispira sp.]|nr:DUF4878 domain-containing protein [Aureispira sp.]
MKFFVLSLIAFSILLSCSKDDKSAVEEVALSFHKKLADYDLMALKPYCTKNMQTKVEALHTQFNAMPEDKKDELRKMMKEKIGGVETVECKIDGEKAECTPCCDKNGKPFTEKILLRKESGKWLVWD